MLNLTTPVLAETVIDDLSDPSNLSNNTTSAGQWECIADSVMGGISVGTCQTAIVGGRRARHLTGTVSLANNGGFVQMALDLVAGGGLVNASAFSGISLTVCGDGNDYGLHLRTADTMRPWQSYRARFRAPATWTTVVLSFTDFRPHRVDAPLDRTRLRRLGLVAIGRAGSADLAVADLRFHHEP